MTLEEFRKLTAHLDGSLEFYVGGAPMQCLYATDECLSVDDQPTSYFMGNDAVGEYAVLFTADNSPENQYQQLAETLRQHLHPMDFGKLKEACFDFVWSYPESQVYDYPVAVSTWALGEALAYPEHVEL